MNRFRTLAAGLLLLAALLAGCDVTTPSTPATPAARPTTEAATSAPAEVPGEATGYPAPVTPTLDPAYVPPAQ